MKRFSRKTLLFILIAGPIWYIAAFCAVTDHITIAYEGFAVDNSGLLYIGKGANLDVYDNGKYIKTIYKTTRAYRFTIQDEKIYMVTEGLICTMDLSGNGFSYFDEGYEKTHQEWDRLDKQRGVFETADAKYVAMDANTLVGLYKITKYDNSGGSTVVYQSRVIDAVLGLALPVLTIIGVIIFCKEMAKYFRVLEEQKRKAMYHD